MSPNLVWIITILLLGAWFFVLAGERSFIDKLLPLLIILAIYVGYQILSGKTLDQVFAPFLGTEVEMTSDEAEYE